jgi:putative ABC transport system permease protein
MFKNYLKIALRNLLRNKIYSSLNIVGLALGMAVALLIGLWVADEFNTNKNFAHYDKIVQLLRNSTIDGHINTGSGMALPLVEKLRKDYTGDFKSVAMITDHGGHSLAIGDKKMGTEGCRYAEPGIIDLLPIQMISGGTNALEAPASMIIDQSLAKKLFGDEDPLNKVVRVDNQQNVRVTGVFQDFPHSSAFGTGSGYMQIHLIESWGQFVAENPGIKDIETDWKATPFAVYARLSDYASIDQVEVHIKDLMSGHGRTDKPELFLYPMSKWHLYNNFTEGKVDGGSIKFVRMFGFIGLFVLLLACVNFMNMSTARSERRSREVGIRKAVGSLRIQLIVQFLGESLLMCCISLLLALLIVQLSLPAFNRIADKNISIPWTSGIFWIMLAGFSLLTALIAGSYPSFYLSSFNAVKVLKGSLNPGRFASLPRKVLVVLQFTVSIALIIGTLIVSGEIQYARNRPVGYDWHGIIQVFRSTPQLMENYNVIRDELLRNGGASDVAISSGPTSMLFSSMGGFSWPGKDPAFADNFGYVSIAQNFGHTIGWQIKHGRDFSKDFPSDSTALVINETAVKYMSLEHAVGTTIRRVGNTGIKHQYHIIGVIADMMMQTPFENPMPTLFSMESPASDLGLINIKLNPSLSTTAALARVEPVFRKYNPTAAFDYWNNEERFGRNFVLEDRIGVLTRIFAAMAIFISCLGMFGLASFTAERRTREIGIRKVLGASVPHLWALLIREFLLLVCLAFLIALPISWFYMHDWLQQYAYRVPISAWIFIGTLGGALLITLITVSFQSIRASLANPVRSLRTE